MAMHHKPPFAHRSPADKLTFFVHAVLSVNGLRLLAVGDIADAPGKAEGSAAQCVHRLKADRQYGLG